MRIDDKFNSQLSPFVALVGYMNSEDVYFEMHPIDDGKLGVGAPLTVECISEIASNFTAEFSTVPHGRIPANFLYFDNRIGYEKYVWYNPPRKRQMYFTASLKIEDGEYHVPGIIYVVHDQKLDVYAFKGKKPSEELFKAPFFNVTDAKVCLGRADVKYPDNPSFHDFIQYWENKFWLTEFSHLGSNPVKGNLVLVTKQSKDKFDEEVLVPIETKLNELFV